MSKLGAVETNHLVSILVLCLILLGTEFSSVSHSNPANLLAPRNTNGARYQESSLQTGAGFTSGFWSQVGPYGTDYASGEMRVVAVNSTDANTLYVGAAEGGVWKATNGGANWTPITDTQLVRDTPIGRKGTLSIGAITIDSVRRPNVVYVGTGNIKRACCSWGGMGLGVFKSSDGGANWTPLGANLGNTLCANTVMSTSVVTRIVVRYLTRPTIFAATNAGIFRYSEDGSDCWQRLTIGLPSGVAIDLVIDELAGTFYGAFWGQGIWKSSDALGDQWVQLTSGFPPGSIGRIFLVFRSFGSGDLTRAKALYAGLHYLGPPDTLHLFKFTFDLADDWSELPNPPQDGQLDFDVAMAIGPHNLNFVYLGLTKLFRSTNPTGGTWTDISCVPPTTGLCQLPASYAMHGDFHDIAFAPLGSFTQTPSVYEIFFLAEDGGIMKGLVDNAGNISWQSITKGLQVGECGTAPLDPNHWDMFACGLWHDGTVLASSSTQTTTAVGTQFKDSYQVAIDAATGGTIVYDNCDAASGGNVCRGRTSPGGQSVVSTDEHICDVGYFPPSGGNKAMWSDPYRPGHLLVLYTGYLIRTKVANTGAADTLKAGCQGASLTNPTFSQPWTIINPLGITSITTMAFRSPFLDSVTGVASPIYYIGTNNGEIWRGSPEVPWQRLCTCSLSPVFGIAAEFFANERLFAVFGGSAGPGRIKELTRIGTTWSVEDIDTNFTPDRIVNRINTVVAKPALWLEQSTTVFIGTDQGVYVGHPEIVDYAPTWVWARSGGVPNVDVIDLVAHQSLLYVDRSHIVRAGTFGRGVFELKDISLEGVLPLFDMDWSDYDNDGKVTIRDMGSAAFFWNKPSDYWDLNSNGRTDIGEIALAALNWLNTFGETPYPGQGSHSGYMDLGWTGLCRALPVSPERSYCLSTSLHNMFFPNCAPVNNQVSCITRSQLALQTCVISFHVKDGFSFRTELTGGTIVRATSGSVTTYANLPSLSPGQEAVSTVPDPTNCGQGLVQLSLDDANVLVESNETDNILQFSLIT